MSQRVTLRVLACQYIICAHPGTASGRRAILPRPVYPSPEKDGWNAGARGERAAANPHEPGSPEAAAWAAGYARWEAFVARERRLWEAGVRAYGRGAPRRAA